MLRPLDTHIDTSVQSIAPPETKWAAWAIWAILSLAAALFGVLVLGLDTGLLLGWAVGIIVAAMMIVLRRK